MSKDRAIRSSFLYKKFLGLSLAGKAAAVTLLFSLLITVAAVGSARTRTTLFGPISAFLGISGRDIVRTEPSPKLPARDADRASATETATPLVAPMPDVRSIGNGQDLVAGVKKPKVDTDDNRTFNAAYNRTEADQLVLRDGVVREFTEGDGVRTRAQKGDGEDHDMEIMRKPLHPGIASDTGRPIDRKPVESKLIRTGKSFDGDLRSLPYKKPVAKERPERGEPSVERGFAGHATPADSAVAAEAKPAAPAAPAPAPIIDFDGLDRESWGAGSPPDTNGDVGPNHYIQTVNTSVGIYDKSTGSPIARFTFNTLMSQGSFGNLCDTDNFGDPVVLYDTFEDRWVLTDFAFKLDGGGAVINPPGSFQCFAVSKTSDPVSGGWNFYSINTVGGLGDYPKFGIWPDGLYMTTSIFDYAAGGAFQNPRAYAFNKAQMYAGAPTVQVVSFNLPSADFTVLPSNARLQTGTPPAGTPNYYVSSWSFLNALSVYKFHVDWTRISLSTFSSAAVPIAATSWPNASVASVPQSGTAQLLDNLAIRAMMQNQYTNIGGVESLWDAHTVRRANTSGFAAPRWYQVTVTGGTVASNILQAATWDPDVANVMHRFMPSLAVNRAGNMAIGYSTSSSTTFPSMKYAGRLSTDPVNTLGQGEQTMFAGTASQTSTNRWGDYSAMTVDPDGCTFWFTSQYANPVAQTFDKRWKTRIGSFQLPACTPVGAGGTVSGTVTSTAGGAPIVGATLQLGARSVTTDVLGNYSFTSIPAGTYPVLTASFAGYGGGSAAGIVVTDGGTTTDNFALVPAATSSCPMDTSTADFQTGVITTLDILSAPGDVTLSNVPTIDQQNTSLIGSGFGFSNTSWQAQTFTPAVTGLMTSVDINYFSLNCGAVTMPNLTVSLRNASGNLPTGADIATATIPGFCNGGGGNFTATFATPPTLTAGTQYALVWRAAAAIPAGSPAPGYFGTASSADPYAAGHRATSTNSGGTWTGASGTANNDFGFKVYMQSGFITSGNLVSGVKDANPALGSTATWGPLSWTATTPAGTDVKFQIAASNNPAGVFNFVGPDGTASTFFTNGSSLSLFNGSRYLKYKALLTGTSAATPTLSDVTICFATTINTSLTADPAVGTYGGTTNLSATMTDISGPVSGTSIAFTLNGNGVGSAVTNASGVATVSNVSLAGINAASYPTGVGASFASDGVHGASSGTAALTVNQAGQTITFGTLADKTYGDPSFTVSATGGASGNPVTFGATGTCTSTGTNGTTITITGAGSCTVTASQLGNSNFTVATSVPRTFAIAKATPTVTWANPAGIVYGTALGAAQLNATASTPGSFVYTPASGVVLGGGSGQNLHVDFTPTDSANYNNASANATINVAKANATCVITGYSVTFNGAAHTATGSCTGIGGAGDVLAGLNLAGTTHTAIGSYPNDPWAFTGGANYNDQNGTVADTIIQALCNEVVVASGLQVLRNQELTVPVTVDNLTGRNVLSFTYTLTYDPTAFSFAGFDQAGLISSGMSFTINNNTPGTLIVVAFGSAPLTGSGTLMNLRFNAYGPIGSTSPLNFGGFSFNEGTPCVNTTNGSASIISANISGVVTYANAPTTRPVPNTVLNAAGTPTVSTNSAFITGAYTLSGMGSGSYTVTPSKSGDVNGITGFDAAMIAQHVAGFITLTATQAAAADVSGNGSVTAFDAALISQWIASIPNSGVTGTWKFTPVNRSYANAETAQTNQDYSAILMGDVSGSWAAPTSISPVDEGTALAAPSDEKAINGSKKKGLGVSAPKMSAAPGAEVVIPISIKDLTGKGVVSYQFDIEYDPAVLEPQETGAELSRTISEGMTVTSNAPTPGLLKVIVYGAAPIEGAGALVNLRFNAIGTAGAASPLTIKQFMLNEGGLKVNTTDGEVTIEPSADATIQGRLLSDDGRLIARARVIATSSSGEKRVAASNSFGVFEFGGLTVGETYTITVESERYRFTPQAISAITGVSGLDLISTR